MSDFFKYNIGSNDDDLKNIGSKLDSISKFHVYKLYMVYGVVIIIIMTCFIIYFKYLYNTRIRFPRFSVLINMKKYIKQHNNEIISLLNSLNYIKIKLLNFENGNKGDVVKFKSIIDEEGWKYVNSDSCNLLTILNNIDNHNTPLDNNKIYKYCLLKNEEGSETFTFDEKLMIILNNYFREDIGDSFNKNTVNSLVCNEIYSILQNFVKEHSVTYITYMNTRSIFNFLDLEQLMDESGSSQSDKLLKKYDRVINMNIDDELEGQINTIIAKLAQVYSTTFDVSLDDIVAYLQHNHCGGKINDKKSMSEAIHKINTENKMKCGSMYEKSKSNSAKFDLNDNGNLNTFDTFDTLCSLLCSFKDKLSDLFVEVKNFTSADIATETDINNKRTQEMEKKTYENINTVYNFFDQILSMTYKKHTHKASFVDDVVSMKSKKPNDYNQIFADNKDYFKHLFQEFINMIHFKLNKVEIEDAVFFTKRCYEMNIDNRREFLTNVVNIQEKLSKLDNLLNINLKRIQEYDKKRNLCLSEIKHYWTTKLEKVWHIYKDDLTEYIGNMFTFKHVKNKYIRDRVVIIGKLVKEPVQLVKDFLEVIKDTMPDSEPLYETGFKFIKNKLKGNKNGNKNGNKDMTNSLLDEEDVNLLNETLIGIDDINLNLELPYEYTKDVDLKDPNDIIVKGRSDDYYKMMYMDIDLSELSIDKLKEIIQDAIQPRSRKISSDSFQQVLDNDEELGKILTKLRNVDSSTEILLKDEVSYYILSELMSIVSTNELVEDEKFENSVTEDEISKIEKMKDLLHEPVNEAINFPTPDYEIIMKDKIDFLYSVDSDSYILMIRDKKITPCEVAHTVLYYSYIHKIYHKRRIDKNVHLHKVNSILEGLIYSNDPDRYNDSDIASEDVSLLLDIFDYITKTSPDMSARIISQFNHEGRIMFELWNSPSTYKKTELIQRHYQINPNHLIASLVYIMEHSEPLLTGEIVDRLEINEIAELLLTLLATSNANLLRRQKTNRHEHTNQYGNKYIDVTWVSMNDKGGNIREDRIFKVFCSEGHMYFDFNKNKIADRTWLFHLILSHISNQVDVFDNETDLDQKKNKFDRIIDNMFELNPSMGVYLTRLYGISKSEREVTFHEKEAHGAPHNISAVKSTVDMSSKGKYNYNRLLSLKKTHYPDGWSEPNDGFIRLLPDVPPPSPITNVKNYNSTSKPRISARERYLIKCRTERDAYIFTDPWEELLPDHKYMDFRYYINKFILFYYIDNNITVTTDDSITLLKRKQKTTFGKVFRSIRKHNPFSKLLKPLIELIKLVLALRSLIAQFLPTILMWWSKPEKLIELCVRLAILFFMLFISIIGNFPYFNDYRFKHFVLYSLLLLIFTLVNVVAMPIILSHVVMLFIFWGLDTVTKGAVSTFYYKYFDASENPPDDWYTTTGFHEGNKTNKGSIIGFKYLPCGKGYKADILTNTMCVKKQTYEPNMCPQANIYRVYNQELGLDAIYPLKPKDFEPSLNFAQKSENGRMQELKAYNKNKRAFYENCSITMKPYDDISKSICKNIDSVSSIDQKKKNELSSMCYDAYCNNGTYEKFCNKLTNKDVDEKFSSEDLKKYYNIAWAFFILITILYASVVLKNPNIDMKDTFSNLMESMKSLNSRKSAKD